MTAEPLATSVPPVAPRPGIVKTLGILNIVFAILLGMSAIWSALMTLAVAMAGEPDAGAKSATKYEITPLTAITGPAMIRFGVIDLATGVPLQVLMFASGIGMVNLRPWGARWWARACWAKIFRLVMVWSYFLIAVVPPVATAMGRTVIAMIREQQKAGGAAGAPSLGQISLIYTVMLSVLGVAIIVLGMIYPVVSLWLLGRPGVKAALSAPETWTPADLDLAPAPAPAPKVTPP